MRWQRGGEVDVQGLAALPLVELQQQLVVGRSQLPRLQLLQQVRRRHRSAHRRDAPPAHRTIEHRALDEGVGVSLSARCVIAVWELGGVVGEAGPAQLVLAVDAAVQRVMASDGHPASATPLAGLRTCESLAEAHGGW